MVTMSTWQLRVCVSVVYLCGAIVGWGVRGWWDSRDVQPGGRAVVPGARLDGYIVPGPGGEGSQVKYPDTGVREGAPLKIKRVEPIKASEPGASIPWWAVPWCC